MPFVLVEPHHGQVLFAADPDLLHLLVGALEVADALVVNPDPDSRLGALLDGDQPVLVTVHG